MLNSCLADSSKRRGLRLDLDLHSVSFSPLSGTSSRVMQRSLALTSLLVSPVCREAAHLIKIHAVLTDLSPLEVEMFETREAAAKWLGVPVRSLLPKASGRTTS